ncbi:MAG TPA: ribonuclease R [Polyangiales bacterium]
MTQRILAMLQDHGQRSLHSGEIRAKLGLGKAEQSALAQALAQLSETGQVTELPGGRYRFRKAPPPPKAAPDSAPSSSHERSGRGRGKQETRDGRLSVHERGFGFVVTEETGPDIFVPPHALGSALHGDKVRVRVFQSPKGFDGSVVEVLERSVHYVGGQLHVLPTGAFVEPDDVRLKAHVQIVGKLPPQARTGLGVIAQIVEYPQVPGDPLQARIVETFEEAEFARFEIRRILLSHAVREDFPEEVLAESSALPDHVTAEERAGREDFRKLDLLTIDPADARDHDDAVWASRLADGYRVIVAIADVSHYVREGSALDREALARGCTIYLPARAIPMLPMALSSELASLLPRKDRLALAVDLELDLSGTVRSYRFVECVMRSAACISYDAVARALGLSEQPARQPAAESRIPLLQTLLEVAKLLGAKRKSRGSLDFDLPEPKVKLDPKTSEPIDIERSRKDPGIRIAYNMIEELMLLANEVVAADLSKRRVAAIYRVHGAPSEEKVLAFAELARSLGFDLDEDVGEQPGKLARFLASVAGTPHAELLGYLMLRAMQQATYTTENIGHFGLAARDYVHFTSPIRRYPDLAVHRVVRKIARGEAIRGQELATQLSSQAAEASRLERRAMLIEREVVDLYRAMLMRDRVGEVFDAAITGITEHGIFAAIDSPFVDVLCRTTTLFPDRYEMDRYGTRLYGLHSGTSYALFDRIKVRIEDVSIARRRVSAVPADVFDTQLAETAAGTPARAAPERPRGNPVRPRPSGAPRKPATGQQRAQERRQGKEQRRKDRNPKRKGSRA